MRPAALIVALALAVAGCGEEEDVSPDFEDRVPLGLELTAADRVLTLGESTTLNGRLSQGKEKLAGETVILEGDPYPFTDDFSELESIETGETGKFEFEATPDANTAYRVAAGELSEAMSPERLVYVDPRTEIESEPTPEGTRYTTIFRHPRDRSIQGSSLHSYASPVADAEATGELNFVRVDRVEQTKAGLSEASIVLPFSADEIRYATCVGYTPDSGLGAPNATCSQTEIKAK